MHSRLIADVFHLPFPTNSFDTVVTDPPWHFELRVSPRAKAVRATDYPLISNQRMHAAFGEIYRVLKPGGHCYVFVPERKLRAALEIINSERTGWEHFNTVAWVKLRRDGTDVRLGLGHTYRGAWEPILCLAKLRRRPLLRHDLPNVLFAPADGGSRKPPELYYTLVTASTAPGGIVLDPFCGTDPLGRCGLTEYTTVSSDIAV